MYIDVSKIDNGVGKVEVINIKLGREKIQKLLKAGLSRNKIAHKLNISFSTINKYLQKNLLDS